MHILQRKGHHLIIFFYFQESNVSNIQSNDGFTKYRNQTISILPVARAKITSSQKHGVSRTLSSKTDNLKQLFSSDGKFQ